MSGDESGAPKEELTSWLAACDDALAAGAGPPADDGAGTPEVLAQRQRGLALLRLLRQALPPKPAPPAAADSEAPTLAPRQATAVTERGPPEVPGYEVLGELGRGGMGVVYKARQVKLDRLVALKVILAGEHAGAGARARFRAEAEAVARLQHPNVVQIYDVGDHQGLPYFSCEFCPGGSLADRLDGTPLPPRPAAALTETLARAVHAAHQAGIVHRDLKPANVLLAADGTPKVIDFGLAKRLDGAGAPTRSGTIMGTPSYMAPEQTGATMAPEQPVAMHQDVGPATDVYALGAILYELLTGRAPFKGSSPMNTVLQLLTCEPVPPRLLQPKVPRDLETVCLKCLQKDAKKRYGSAAELAEDLRRFLAGEPIRARPIGPCARAFKWVQRRPAVAALVGASSLAVLALVALAMGLFYNTHLQAALREAERQHRIADEQRARAEHLQYDSDMNLAQRAWQENEPGRMAQLLERHRPDSPDPADLRGFDWYYLRRLSHTELVAFKGHPAMARGVAFSPDGLRLATVGGEVGKPGEVKVWDAWTGQEILSLLGHKGQVLGVAFSPDGKRLASAGTATDDRGQALPAEVKVWDAASGREVLSLTFGGPCTTIPAVAFSPEGQRLAGHIGREVKVWDAGTGAEILYLKDTNEPAVSTGLAFSPDGKRLAAGWSDGIAVWDVPTGQRAPFSLREQATGYGGHVAINGVTFSPDGRYIASCSSDVGGAVKVWDANSGQMLLTLGTRSSPTIATGVAFSPDGVHLAAPVNDVNAPGEVSVWDLQTGEEAFRLRGHAAAVTGIAFSPGSDRLAAACSDGSVKVWDATTDQERRFFQGQHGVGLPTGGLGALNGQRGGVGGFFGFGSDCRGALGGFGGGFAGALGGGYSLVPGWTPMPGLAISPDGRRLAAAVGADLDKPGEVRVWDPRTGHHVLSLPVPTGAVYGVVFSADGTRLAGALLRDPEAGKPWASEVRIWDAASGGLLLTIPVQTGLVFGLAFSPDGQMLGTASGGTDDGMKALPGEVQLWDAATGRDIRTVRPSPQHATALAFSPDGTYLAAATRDGAVLVWDVGAGGEAVSLPGRDPSLPVNSLAFSRDGRTLAAAGGDTTVRLWDTGTWKETRTLGGNDSAGLTVAFSPDGKQVASASLNGLVKVWDLATGEEVLSFNSLVSGLAFSPDGRHLASVGMGWAVRVWDAEEPAGPGGPASRRKLLKEQGLAWHQREAEKNERSGFWFAARFHLDPLVGERPNDAALRARRGNVLAELGWWDAAAADLARALEREPAVPSLWVQQARLRLQAEDRDGYRKACAAMLVRFGQTKSPETANSVAWACALLPDAVANYKEPLRLAELAVVADPTNWDRLRTHGALLYRAGQTEKAVERLEEAVKAPTSEEGDPWSLAFLAMAHQRLGHKEEAKDLLDKSSTAAEMPPDWGQRLELQRLMREAEQQVKGSKP